MLEKALETRISRRSFLGWLGLTVAEIVLAQTKVQAESFWPVEATRRWYPAQKSVAEAWEIEVLDDPDGALPIYEEIHKDAYGEESGAWKACNRWSERLRKMKDPTVGYCPRAAAARILFPPPSMDSVYYQKSDGTVYEIDYAKKLELLTALATQAVPLGFTKYDYGSDAYRERLGLYTDGTARWPFLASRPKPGQDGEWYVMCDGVADDCQSFKSDDFNLKPSRFPSRLIKTTYDPYFPIKGQIPDELKGEVAYWQGLQSSKDIRIPVRRELVFSMVYGEPLAEARNMEDKATSLVMARQQKVIAVRLSDHGLSRLSASSPAEIDSLVA